MILYFNIFPEIDAISGWEIGGVIISAVLGFLTLGALLTTWRIWHLDALSKNSLFYLKQIKSFLSRATSILATADNDNVKWHQAIDCIKTADELKSKLTEKPHQQIYIAEYLDAAYGIHNIIKNINDSKFFYGISDYKNKDSEILYQESTPQKLDNTCSRISPDMLLFLCVFMDKADKARFDILINGTSWESVFPSSYFNKPMSNISITELGLGASKVVDYIKDYKNQENHVSERGE